MPTYISVS